MKIITYRAAIDDIEELETLFDQYRQFYEQKSDPARCSDFLRERISTGDSIIFISKLNERGVGFTQLYPSFSSVSLTRIFILNDLFVSQDYRRHGVGAMLLN